MKLNVSKLMNSELIPLVNQFRQLQDVSGRVIADMEQATRLLSKIRPITRTIYETLGMENCAAAFETDIDNWLHRGLNDAPAFDNSIHAYVTPPDGGLSFFIGAYSCTNGEAPVGYFLECFLAERKEPKGLESLVNEFPNPQYFTQIGRLLAASNGLIKGNCISFFPENIAAQEPVTGQTFALFFLNKSQQIYYESTLPLVQNLLPDITPITATISQDDSYEALGLWSYLHEYFHNSGPRPLNTNLRAKMNFFAGVLEEIKVDIQTILICYQNEHPLKDSVMEFILFERLFRYARQPDPTNNFDAGTGFYLYEWLYRNGYGISYHGKQLHVEYAKIIEGLIVLAETINALETIQDDAIYKKAAKAMVRLILPEGPKGTRFLIPENYLNTVDLTLPFNDAEFQNMVF